MAKKRTNSQALGENRKLIGRRSPEWIEFVKKWQWLSDSYEGGDRYRYATYGTDARGVPRHNLVRHKREYPTPTPGQGAVLNSPNSSFAAAAAPPSPTDDDFEMRRARTPVPTFVQEAIDGHLAQIYSREVKREAPDVVVEWWKDVDGRGTSIDDWMKETISPLLLNLGQIDVMMDHPPAPEGSEIATKADQVSAGLDKCIASYILPENMLWWEVNSRGRYAKCMVRECREEDGEEKVYYRLWTDAESVLYDSNGEERGRLPHPFKEVPIRRIFDRRRPRCKHVGKSRYESVAEYQREFYNRDSELILSDTTQAHPLLQGPEDYVGEDGSIPIGPSWMLPKKKTTSGSSPQYEGFEFISPPKDGAESIRQNKHDIREAVDRATHQLKPAGSSGSSKGTLEQSGISKSLDHQPAHNNLAQISNTLSRFERSAVELAMVVLTDGGETDGAMEEVDIVYPSNFDLYSSSDVAVAQKDFQLLASETGIGLPNAEKAMLQRLYRLVMPGLTDDQYVEADKEIAKFIDAGGGIKAKLELMPKPEAPEIGKPTPVSVKPEVSDPSERLQPPGKGGGNPGK